MNPYIEIQGRRIGLDYAPLVIAEIGINHNGSVEEAKKLVRAAKEAGAEVVKHQTHIPSEEMSQLARKAIPGNSPFSIWDIMERCALSEEDEIEMKRYTEELGMIFISTPFSFAAADRLKKMDIPAYKIGSGEMNNYDFVSYIASFHKPIIISTGMNDIESVKKAVAAIEKYHKNYVIMHTTNLYPTPSHLIRLGALEEMKNEFPGAIIGLSDHSLNNLACLSAVALGASVLERHFTDTKERKGEDIICSMDIKECKELIEQSAEVQKMRGGKKEAAKEEKVTIEFAFSTLVAANDIPAGTCLTREMFETKRPYLKGILASDMDKVIGRTTANNILKGQHFEWNDLVS
jgi:N-acetylneuraminate synthase